MNAIPTYCQSLRLDELLVLPDHQIQALRAELADLVLEALADLVFDGMDLDFPASVQHVSDVLAHR